MWRLRWHSMGLRLRCWSIIRLLPKHKAHIRLLECGNSVSFFLTLEDHVSYWFCQILQPILVNCLAFIIWAMGQHILCCLGILSPYVSNIWFIQIQYLVFQTFSYLFYASWLLKILKFDLSCPSSWINIHFNWWLDWHNY